MASPRSAGLVFASPAIATSRVRLPLIVKLRMIARLTPEATTRQAAAELNGLSAAMVRDHPTEYARAGMLLIPFREQVTGGVRPLLLAIVGAVDGRRRGCPKRQDVLIGDACRLGAEMSQLT